MILKKLALVEIGNSKNAFIEARFVIVAQQILTL